MMNQPPLPFLFFVLFALVGTFPSAAQNLPYQGLSFWNTETIQTHQIHSISSYEFESPLEDSILSDSVIKTGIWQALEEFDTLGRICSKTNFYTFSDQQYTKRTLTYHPDGTVKSYVHYVQTDLVRAELYHWEHAQLSHWIITLTEPNTEKPVIYSKEIQRDTNGTAQLMQVKIGEEVVLTDGLFRLDLPNASVTLVRPLNDSITTDSIVEYHPRGDTVLNKKSYHHGQLEYHQTHWSYGGEFTQKVVEYQQGEFYRAYYRRFKNQQLILEKQIHQLPNLNFSKLYFYNPDGLPLKKEIYRNTELPVSIVYYLHQRFKK